MASVTVVVASDDSPEDVMWNFESALQKLGIDIKAQPSNGRPCQEYVITVPDLDSGPDMSGYDD